MRSQESTVLCLGLYGPFTLVDSKGISRAPKSAKSQVLIALVATNETGSRGRLWLQKMLWANSTLERASVSLRQTLSEVRRAFGPLRDVIKTDRRSVALDMSRILLLPKQEGQEFLDGTGQGFGNLGL